MAENEIPRRAYVDRWTPAERAIKDAMGAVEEAGCHPLLTDAVNLLGQAFEKVADFVELPSTPVDEAPKAHIIDLMEALKASLAAR
jgi:hypothetical protein